MPTQAERSALANTLLRVKHALEAANLCITGETVEEVNQHTDNETAIGLLGHKIHQVVKNGFNMQTGHAAWRTVAEHLRIDAESCTSKSSVIDQSKALINMVPLHLI